MNGDWKLALSEGEGLEVAMDEEVREFLLKHLQGIMNNDIASYHETTAEDLTLYEWWVTPHRLNGLPFHEFMMTANAGRGTSFGAEGTGQTRFDLSNLYIQRYGDTAIASYTLLISAASDSGVQVAAHNESRVMIRMGGQWKVVHVHKSPAYSAPHVG
ncbi:MAG: nuclear transport factor 2 family protein [Anaerolineales bacterium]|nr:nuclear transport factor 2 family protein [Anaerolineales bacterium]